jgi:hypothetical protein
VDHVIRFSTTPEGLTAALAAGDYIQVAYDLIYFDSFAHGVVTNGGLLVTTRPDLMTVGTHDCLTWDGSDTEPIEQEVLVRPELGGGSVFGAALGALLGGALGPLPGPWGAAMGASIAAALLAVRLSQKEGFQDAPAQALEEEPVGPQPFAETVFDLVPADWRDGLFGEVMVAVHLTVTAELQIVPAAAAPARFGASARAISSCGWQCSSSPGSARPPAPCSPVCPVCRASIACWAEPVRCSTWARRAT